MYTYEKSSIIRCSEETLFDFHLNPENLKEITPPNMKVELQNSIFEAKQGEVLKIKSIKYAIPTIWEVQIAKLQRPNILIDVALKSPFKYWEHSHIFTKKGNNCELKDVVKYELPFYFLNPIINYFIDKELDSMFTYRHKKTKELVTK